ncbi:MAG: dienelactone hydrolase family protein [Acidobacteriota bacterium]|nr:MAG: dienelactone hydrolase family protein [Acidobacteriota bacterium]
MTRGLLIILILAAGVFAQADPLSQPGPYAAGWRSVTITRPNNSTFTARLYYPAAVNGQNTAYNGAGAPYPAITFGHGFLQAVSTYQSTLNHLATHGYFVIASDSENGLFPSHQNFANDLRFSLDHLTQQNGEQSSFLFNQVATTRYGASGHSMGGGASILAASQDARIKALANLAAVETNPSATAAMSNVNVPVSLISGSADTIVPVSSNGQLMYNAGRAPKMLPVIQGGWHCGFQESNGIGCDNGTITRAQQLAETRRLLTAFFDLYLKGNEERWKQVWGSGFQTAVTSGQRNSGIELTPAEQIVTNPVGVETTFSVTVTNRGATPAAYRAFIEQRRWVVGADPAITGVIAPNASANITFRVRRHWKNNSPLENLLISIRNESDGLTRNFTPITLRPN